MEKKRRVWRNEENPKCQIFNERKKKKKKKKIDRSVKDKTTTWFKKMASSSIFG